MSAKSLSRVIPILVLVLLLFSPAAAHAAGPATFSSPTPSPGSTVPQAKPIISVRAYDAAGIRSNGYWIKVDGVKVYCRLTYPTVGVYTAALLSTTPSTNINLANGPHNVEVQVGNYSYQYSTYSWSFSVGIAPSLSNPQPSATVESSATTVSANVVSQSPVSSTRITVNGQEIPSVYDAGAGVVSGRVTGLLDGLDYAVAIAVTDSLGATGNMSFSFHVSIPSPMTPPTDCLVCHPSFPELHPMDNCDGCHGPGSPEGSGWTNPPDPPHSYEYLSWTPGVTCNYCHSATYSATVPMHMQAPRYYHSTAGDFSDCAVCHQSNMIDEHAERTDDAGYPIGCTTCHSSTDSAVRAAIASGNAACFDCHADAYQSHQSAGMTHESIIASSTITGAVPGTSLTYSFECGQCHSAELMAEHARASSSSSAAGCAACHPNPRSSLTAWTKTCVEGDCHKPGTAQEMHAGYAAKHVPATDVNTYGCAGNPESPYPGTCHTVADISTPHFERGGSDCLACHGPSVMPTTNACRTCHDTSVRSHHPRDEQGVYQPIKECRDCHHHDSLNIWLTECIYCHPRGAYRTP